MGSKDSNETPPRLDPELKKAVLRWEEQAAAAWTRMLRDPRFLRQMWRAVEGGFHTQQLISEQMASHAATLQFPSRIHQQELDEALNRLETRLARLDEQVDRLLEEQSE